MSPRVPVAGPSIGSLEEELVLEAVRHGWYENAGLYPDRFERAFAERHGVRHAFSLPSCTAGLHLALAALDLGPGDEVIVPELTWIATAAPVVYVGATPVFADVDEADWCIDPAAVEACISSRTRAIIAVDLYGAVCDMKALRGLSERHGLALIEDAAEAVGSRRDGRMAGSLGDVGVFSFHGSKTMTTGEGGMLVTDRDDIAYRVRVLRDHGRDPGDRWFWNREVGFKYRMGALPAALGLAQLQRLDELVEQKRRIFSWYAEALADVPGVSLNVERPTVHQSYWMTTLLLDRRHRLRKEALYAGLSALGIDVRPFFHPLSELPAFAHLSEARAAHRRNHVAYDVSSRGINLPSALSLTRADIERVARAVKLVLGVAAERAA
ncbi:MAG: DegT/DnrJ/EryC1/StrS family aminotransferase [Myxococcales bacterium]|nr:DegT/DnrJ/EryC1/StrS family aminotransferase [Myxococcales bacterium]